MTTQNPPQIPESLQAAMAEWHRHESRIQQIDSDLRQLDVRIGEYTRTLNELREAHAALGRDRTAVESESAFARDMVEHGCQRLGIDVPSAPVTPQQPPPAPVAPIQPAPPQPAELPAGVEPIPAGGDPLTPPTEQTVTDPPDGGGQPEPGFQPAPEQPEPRRRRGGRGRGE